jgi:hypothetical protein
MHVVTVRACVRDCVTAAQTSTSPTLAVWWTMDSSSYSPSSPASSSASACSAPPASPDGPTPTPIARPNFCRASGSFQYLNQIEHASHHFFMAWDFFSSSFPCWSIYRLYKEERNPNPASSSLTSSWRRGRRTRSRRGWA